MNIGVQTTGPGDVAGLNWKNDDIEQKLGFTGGQFTSVNKLLSFLTALVLAIIWYGIVLLAKAFHWTWLSRYFWGHHPMPELICLLFFWGMIILFVKQRKLRYQRRALDLAAVPRATDFVLDRRTAAEVLKRVNKLVDSTSHFILLNRIERALSNLRNIGNVSEVSQILRNQAEYDEEQVGSSYKLVAGFVWAIPVLGFIGTVLGLSTAMGGFSHTLESQTADLSKQTDALRETAGGLSTAFDVTFIALAATLVVQLYMTHLQHEEASFLDECNNYCHANVVSKLRLSDDEG